MEPTTHNEALARHQTGAARLQAEIVGLIREIDQLARLVRDQQEIIAAYEQWTARAAQELEGRKEKAVDPDEWVKRWYGVDLKTEEANPKRPIYKDTRPPAAVGELSKEYQPKEEA